MTVELSKLEAGRRNGETQVAEQRDAILDSAEELFLHRGLERTTIAEIAEAAGITRMSLYRYFRNREEIAVQIYARMMNRIAAVMPSPESEFTIENARTFTRLMIRHFDKLRDAYRFIGMFSGVYLDNAADAPRGKWVRETLPSLLTYRIVHHENGADPQTVDRINVVMSTVIWFLEKLALRGELAWIDRTIPLEGHLELFEEMVVGYLNRLLESTLEDA